MKTLDNYIFEKLHLTKGMQSSPDIDDIVDSYKDKYDKQSLEKLKKILMIAKRQANTQHMITCVVSVRWDENDFAWTEWRDHFEIGGKTGTGATILFKIYPNK